MKESKREGKRKEERVCVTDPCVCFAKREARAPKGRDVAH